MSLQESDVGCVIICDDVRREQNGKDILIGVYSSDIVVPSLPFGLNLALWFEYKAPVIGQNTIFVQISYNGQPRGKFHATVEVTVQNVGMAFPPFPLNSDSAGDLVIEYSRTGTEWTEIKRKRVLVGNVASLTRVAPPLGSG